MTESADYSAIIFHSLEALSFIATIILVIVSLKALSQIDVAKRALKVQSKREARKISADYTYVYLDRILKAKHNIEVSKEQVKVLSGFYFSKDNDRGVDKKRISQGDSRIKLRTDGQLDAYEKKLREAYKPFRGLLNELEAFAAAVTSGILDERILFRAVGKNYVSNIEELNLSEVLHYLGKRDGLYTNIVEIFDLWQLRITLSQLEEAEERSNKVNEEIKKLKSRLGSQKSRVISPIGVSD